MRTAEICLIPKDKQFNIKLKDDGIVLKNLDIEASELKDFMERKLHPEILEITRQAVKMFGAKNIKLHNL